MAGLGPAEIDVAELYDCFTSVVLVRLEDYGFCKKGEGGPFVENGRIGLGGELPVNTSGGLLSQVNAGGSHHGGGDANARRRGGAASDGRRNGHRQRPMRDHRRQRVSHSR
jgi:hypothetical protein